MSGYGYGEGCGYGEGGYGSVVWAGEHGEMKPEYGEVEVYAPEMEPELALEEVREVVVPESECEKVGRLFPMVPAKAPEKEVPKA